MRVEDTFHKYVNPEVRTEYWDQWSISVHSILRDDERIINASNMRTVWPEFQHWFFRHLSPAEKVVLVAWNGETCDLKWLWRLIQSFKFKVFFAREYQVLPWSLTRDWKVQDLRIQQDKVKDKRLWARCCMEVWEPWLQSEWGAWQSCLRASTGGYSHTFKFCAIYWSHFVNPDNQWNFLKDFSEWVEKGAGANLSWPCPLGWAHQQTRHQVGDQLGRKIYWTSWRTSCRPNTVHCWHCALSKRPGWYFLFQFFHWHSLRELLNSQQSIAMCMCVYYRYRFSWKAISTYMSSTLTFPGSASVATQNLKP